MGLVRIWKVSKLARDTHQLGRAEVGIGKNVQIKQASKGHSQSRAEVGIGKNTESKQASKRHLQTREGRDWDW